MNAPMQLPIKELWMIASYLSFRGWIKCDAHLVWFSSKEDLIETLQSWVCFLYLTLFLQNIDSRSKRIPGRSMLPGSKCGNTGWSNETVNLSLTDLGFTTTNLNGGFDILIKRSRWFFFPFWVVPKWWVDRLNFAWTGPKDTPGRGHPQAPKKHIDQGGLAVAGAF